MDLMDLFEMLMLDITEALAVLLWSYWWKIKVEGTKFHDSYVVLQPNLQELILWFCTANILYRLVCDMCMLVGK